MPSKITNPVREGLSGKIFAICYLQPEIVYRVAKATSGVSKNPATGRIFQTVKKMKTANLLERIDTRYRSRSDVIVEEIRKILKQKQNDLRESEIQILRQMLDLDSFRSFVSDLFTPERIASNGDIVGIICELLSEESCGVLINRNLKRSKDFSLGFKSEKKYVIWVKAKLAEIDQGNFGNLPLELMTIEKSIRREYDRNQAQPGLVRYWVCYYLLSSSLLEKLVTIDEASSSMLLVTTLAALKLA